MGIATGPGDKIHVVGNGDAWVRAFTGTGALLSKFSAGGGGRGVAVDANGDVYFLENLTYFVRRYRSDGTLVRQWGGGTIFVNAGSIAVDAAGYVYVTDWNDDEVFKFTGLGVFVQKWPTRVRPLRGTPWGVTCAPDGNLWVSSLEGLVSKYTNTGVLLSRWGSYGSAPGQMMGARGIALDPDGFVYVADTENNRLQKFTQDGSLLAVWGGPGSGPEQFNLPWALTTDTLGNVYVADYGNHRVQKFGPGPTPATTTTWGRLKALYR